MIKRHRHWAANWIRAPAARFPNAHVLFRRDFELPAIPRQGECYIAVETFARVYLNGSEIRRTSGLSYPGEQPSETIDLLPHLRAGRNELAVVAWWTGVGCTSRRSPSTSITRATSLLEELADNIEWLHRWFLKCRDDRGLFFNPHPPVANWQDNTLTALTLKHQFRTPLLASNLRYLLFLDDIAALLPKVASQALAERHRLANIIVECFTDSTAGLLRECADATIDPIFAEYSAALAVIADLPNLDTAGHFDRTLAHPQCIPASPFGKHQTFEALGKLGRPADIVQQVFTLWGPMLDAGSDTAWEWFPPRISSYCHGWSGIPIVSLLRHVLQIDPRHPHHQRKENHAGVAWLESRCSVLSLEKAENGS